MLVKTAAVELKALLEAAQLEGRENIKRARLNARCAEPDKLMPYENEAMTALIRGAGALLDLVQGGPSG